MGGGYSTREVSELIGLRPAQVRHYVRRELLRPIRGGRNEFRFTFQDVVLLRTAKGLLDAKVSTRKAYKVLLKLQGELNRVKSLAALRIFADGSNVVIREENQVWDVESGQGHLDFSVRELANNVASLANRHFILAQEADELNSDEWYNVGLDLEEVDPEKAPEAYRRALALNPKSADAHVNLGRLLQLKGDLKRAKQHYKLALESSPDHQLAFYNMGTVFDELDEVDSAAEYYRRAPAVPDAHFNLARICETRGDEVSALRHMREYRQLLDID
ncbi:MAG: tetratricopeptide repeat protein [Gammaproteobacteria bacterium]|nr:tetratricopeptide repeat protein [Gammaproteobacteria bacterium]MCZ6854533.1 tetratricopeptide repeat protein [Gammaproteobacteria bacterium]